MPTKNISKYKNKIIIIDFGSQVTKLIARRIRELKIYCEIVNLKDLKKFQILKILKELFYLVGLNCN